MNQIRELLMSNEQVKDSVSLSHIRRQKIEKDHRIIRCLIKIWAPGYHLAKNPESGRKRRYQEPGELT